MIEQNYKKILATLSKGVTLVAVSKTKPVESIQQLYDLGQRIFGENKVQELVDKKEKLPNDIQWHLIGHLQTNKVKYIAPFVHTIQSVDSQKILIEIQKEAAKNNRTIEVYLQIKIAKEETKYGLRFSEAVEIVNLHLEGKFPNITITGVMGMASFSEDQHQVQLEFECLKNYFDQLKNTIPLVHLSMGMSGDYLLAMTAGATSVRIGSSLFGDRN